MGTAIGDKLRKKIINCQQDNYCSDSFWDMCRRSIVEMCKLYSLETFRVWPIIKQTMDVGNAEYTITELEELKKSPFYDLYSKAFEYDEKIIPNENKQTYRIVKQPSGNSIHHIYHINKLLSMYNRNIIPEMKKIYEFGAGFGSTCRLFYELGFQGEYYITDFPEFCYIQEYYLQSNGVDINKVHWGTAKPPESILSNLDLFISEWSLSEVNHQHRMGYLNIKSTNYLLAYSLDFFGQENQNYFNEFITNNPNHLWYHDYTIHEDKRHKYLIGYIL